jgi:hypothetical protein
VEGGGGSSRRREGEGCGIRLKELMMMMCVCVLCQWRWKAARWSSSPSTTLRPSSSTYVRQRENTLKRERVSQLTCVFLLCVVCGSTRWRRRCSVRATDAERSITSSRYANPHHDTAYHMPSHCIRGETPGTGTDPPRTHLSTPLLFFTEPCLTGVCRAVFVCGCSGEGSELGHERHQQCRVDGGAATGRTTRRR